MGLDPLRECGNLLMNRAVMFSSASTHWDTPDDLYRALNEEFGFTYDPCPSIQGEFELREDGSHASWAGQTVFMNPPYGSELASWMAKAQFESERHGITVVCLVPARTDTRWWHYFAMNADEIRFLRGRLRFGDAKNSAPFPSALIIFRGASKDNFPQGEQK